MNDDQVASQMTVANAIATIPQAQSERSTNVCLLFFSRVTLNGKWRRNLSDLTMLIVSSNKHIDLKIREARGTVLLRHTHTYEPFFVSFSNFFLLSLLFLRNSSLSSSSYNYGCFVTLHRCLIFLYSFTCQTGNLRTDFWWQCC